MLNFHYLRRHAGTPPSTPHLAPIGHGQVKQFPVQAKYNEIKEHRTRYGYEVNSSLTL